MIIIHYIQYHNTTPHSSSPSLCIEQELEEAVRGYVEYLLMGKSYPGKGEPLPC